MLRILAASEQIAGTKGIYLKKGNAARRAIIPGTVGGAEDSTRKAWPLDAREICELA
jgi:hypothetical protein